MHDSSFSLIGLHLVHAVPVLSDWSMCSGIFNIPLFLSVQVEGLYIQFEASNIQLCILVTSRAEQQGSYLV